MSAETILPANTADSGLNEFDLLALDYLHEEPGEAGSDVAFHIAVAMAGLTEHARTRPLAEIIAQEHPQGGVGEATFAQMMALAAEHGFTTGDAGAAATESPASL